VKDPGGKKKKQKICARVRGNREKGEISQPNAGGLLIDSCLNNGDEKKRTGAQGERNRPNSGICSGQSK